MGKISSVVKLTPAVVRTAKPLILADGTIRQRLLFDSRTPGFGLVVGKTTRSFIIQKSVNGRSVRITLGRYPEDLSLEKARRAAGDYREDWALRKNPVAERMTLRQALVLAEASLKARGRSTKTLKNLTYPINTYLASWLERRLHDITVNDVITRLERIAEEVARGKYAKGRKRTKEHGKDTANRAIRAFRMVYNRMKERHPQLPPNPSTGLKLFELKETKTLLPLSALPTWHSAVMALKNTLRRDCLLFTLHTGLRRKNASEARWEHIDLDRGTMHIPDPKSGEAFDLPLTPYLIALLERRKQENEEIFENSEWVFPADSKSGHVAELREEFPGIKFRIHDLRRAFISAARAAKVYPYDLRLLVNHDLPKKSDVTAGYMEKPDVEELRPAMAQIGAKLAALCTPPATPPVVDNVVPLRQRA